MMDWISPAVMEVLISILKSVVILLVVVTCGAYMSLGERRILASYCILFTVFSICDCASQPDLACCGSEHRNFILPDDGRSGCLRGAVCRLVK